MSTALSGWMTYQVIRTFDEDSGMFDYVFGSAVLLLSVTALIVTVYRMLQKPSELRLDQGKLHVNGRTLRAEDIQVIMKNGYFRPVIGIKPYGKRIVPVPYCLRFAKEVDQGVDDLTKWAEQNGVRVAHKFFMRWL
jgi:hypothetical protein